MFHINFGPCILLSILDLPSHLFPFICHRFELTLTFDVAQSTIWFDPTGSSTAVKLIFLKSWILFKGHLKFRLAFDKSFICSHWPVASLFSSRPPSLLIQFKQLCLMPQAPSTTKVKSAGRKFFQRRSRTEDPAKEPDQTLSDSETGAGYWRRSFSTTSSTGKIPFSFERTESFLKTAH